MEAYSTAYAHAVAAAAGVSIGSIWPDINSLDVQFMSPDDGVDAGNCSHVQLKSTATPLKDSGTPGCKVFKLRVVDHERLRKVTRIPRLLVVMQIPKDPEDWITCDPDEMVLKASARWVSLSGQEKTDYKDKVPIDVPDANIFTPEALIATMGSLNDV